MKRFILSISLLVLCLLISETTFAQQQFPITPNSQVTTGNDDDVLRAWLEEIDVAPGGTLLYRRSTNGSNATAFHNAVSGQGPAIALIKLNNGNVFGFYNPVGWNRTNQYVGSTDAFIFNLTSDRKGDANPSYANRSIFDYQYYGPTLGQGHDLYIDGNLTGGHVYGWYTFNAVDGTGIRSSSFVSSLTGLNVTTTGAYSITGLISEIEVYKIEFNVSGPIIEGQDITVQLDENGHASIIASDVDNGTTDPDGPVTLSIDITDFTCDELGGNSTAISPQNIGNVSQATQSHGGGYNPHTREFWYPQWANPTVYRYDENRNFLGTFNTGQNQIMQLWMDLGSEDYYTANWGYNTITRRSGSSTVWTYNMGATAAAVSTDAEYVYAYGAWQNYLRVLDKETGAFVKNITLPGGIYSYGGLVVANGHIYIAGYALGWSSNPNDWRYVHQLDMDGNYIGSTYSGETVYNMAFDGETMWIDDFGNFPVGVKIAEGSAYEGSGGSNAVTLTATDPLGNSRSAVFAVTVEDNIAPTIVLNGDAQMSVDSDTGENASFDSLEPGATASDNCSAEVEISGTVDMATPGIYTLSYKAIDQSGNESASITREVTVVDASAPEAKAGRVVVELDENGEATVDPASLDNGSTDNGNGTLTFSLDRTTFDCNDLNAEGGNTGGNAIDMVLVGNVNQPTYSHGGGYNPNTNEFWYPEWYNGGYQGTIYVYDENHQYVRTLNAGAGQKMQLWMDTDSETEFYTANWTISSPYFYAKYDLNGQEIWRYNNANGNYPSGISTDADYAYVLAYGGNRIDVLDKNTGQFQRSIPLPGQVYHYGGLVVANEQIYIAGQANSWSTNPNDLRYVHRLDMDGNYISSISTNGVYVYNMAFDGEVIWVSQNSNTITGIQISDGNGYGQSGGVPVTLTVTDELGNSSTDEGAVVVVDLLAPTIAFNGDQNVTTPLGSTFNDPGATADDNCSATVEVVGTVDINTLGDYTLTYKAIDGSGNESAEITRTVTVVPSVTSSIGIITQDSDIQNDGLLLEANNVGSGAANIQLNGVCFTNSATSFAGMSNGGGDFCSDCTPGTAFDQLMSTLVFEPSGQPATLTLNNLVPGNKHRLQVFLSNDVNATGANMVFTMQNVNIPVTGWRPNSIAVVIEFTPQGSSEVLTITADGNRAVVNGYTLHDLDQVGILCNEDPMASSQGDITVGTGASGDVTITLDGSSSTDDNGIESYEWFIAGNSVGSGSTLDTDLAIGTYSGELVVTDIFGQTSSVQFSIAVIDVTPPSVITKDVTVGLDANGNATITTQDIDNGSSDNSGGTLSFSLDQTSFDCNDLNNSSPCGGSAVDFNSTNNYIDASDNAWFPNDQVDDYTYEAWINVDDINALQGIVDYAWTVNTNEPHSGVWVSNGQLEARVRSDNGVSGYFVNMRGGTLVPNQWHHVALSKTGSTYSLYLDGVLVNSQQVTINPSWTFMGRSKLLIGSLWNTSVPQGPLNGRLDEVRIWSTGRTLEEINAGKDTCIDPSETGLEHYYKMNEGSGTTVSDETSRNNTGNFVNLNGNSPWVAGAPVSISGTVVTLTVTDSSGNTSTATAKVTLEDNIAPEITGPADIDVFATSAEGAVVNYSTPVGTDNCSVTTEMTAGFADGAKFPIGTTVVTYTATDGSGNEASASFNVTVTGLPPEIVVPANITVDTDAGECGAIVEFEATENTAIPGSTITYDIQPGSFFAVGTTTVTATATNSVGISTKSFTVTVEDNVAPVISVQNATIQLDQNGQGSIQLTDILLSSSDDCGISSEAASKLAFDCSNVGANTVTITVTDVNGQITQEQVTVTVLDVLPIEAGDDVFTLATCEPITFSAADLLGNDSDPYNGNLQLEFVSQPSSGSIVDNGNGTYTYTPGQNTNHTATASYLVKRDDGTIVFAENGHFYQYVEAVNIHWTDAKAAAESMTFGGQQGYLVTITSASENQFAASRLGGQAWMGASDAQVENQWTWVTGPEAGTVFYNQATGQAVNGQYNNWQGGEPNEFGSGEDYAHFRSSGQWNDFPLNGNNEIRGYIVEYGGSAGDCDIANTATGTITFELKDTIAPTVVTRNIRVDLDANGNASITAAQINNGSADDCGIASMTLSQTSFSCNNLGANTVTLTVTDVNGNVSTGTAIVTVEDNIAPEISGPADIDVFATSAAGAVVNYSTPVGTDNCSVTTELTAGEASGATFPIGTTLVTYTATDASGNTASTSFNVNVTGLPPQIVVPENITVSNDTGECGAIVDFAATETTAIPQSTITYDIQPGTFFPVGTTTVTATATNPVGTSTDSFTVTVVDNEGPMVITQDLVIDLDENGNASITAYQMNDGSADNCEVASISLSQTEFDCSNVGDNTVTLTVIDIHGNTASQTATVKVNDVTAPEIDIQDITVSLDASGNYSLDPDSLLETPESARQRRVAIRRAEQKVLRATQATFVANFIVERTEGELATLNEQLALATTEEERNTIQGLIDDKELDLVAAQDRLALEAAELEESQNALAALLSVVTLGNTSDACGIDTIVASQLDFDCSHVGSNTITLTVTDVNNNVSTSIVVVTVVDDTPAEVITQDIVVDLDANGSAIIAVDDIDGGSNDACGIASRVLDVTSFDCGDTGPNVVTLTVTDVNGNVSSKTATVTVRDVIAPTVLTKDITVALDENGEYTITASDIDNGSFDNCDFSLSLDNNAFNCNTLGANIVNLTATDASGNETTMSATVTVIDNAAPVIVANNIVVELDENGSASITVSDVDGGTYDNCGVASVTIDVDSFDCDDLGENIVTITATDVNGNVSSGPAVVNVIDVIAPTVGVQNISVDLDENGVASIVPEDALLFSEEDVLRDTECDLRSSTLKYVMKLKGDTRGNVGSSKGGGHDKGKGKGHNYDDDDDDNDPGKGKAKGHKDDDDNDDDDNDKGGNYAKYVFDGTGKVLKRLDGSLSVSGTLVNQNDPSDSYDLTLELIGAYDYTTWMSMDKKVKEIKYQLYHLDWTYYTIANGSLTGSGINTGTTVSLGEYSNKDGFQLGDWANGENSSEGLRGKFRGISDSDFKGELKLDVFNCELLPVPEGTVYTRDNCTIVDFSFDRDTFTCADLTETVVNLTATDQSGNTTTVPVTVTVNDRIAPVVVTQDITVSLGVDGSVTVDPSLLDGGSTDNTNCGLVFTLDRDTFDCGDITKGHSNGKGKGHNYGDDDDDDDPGEGNGYGHKKNRGHKVTLTVTDAAGNSSSATAYITVIDDVAPVISSVPVTVVVYDKKKTYLSKNDIGQSVSDNCQVKDIKFSRRKFGRGDAGLHNILVTAVDYSGNTTIGNVVVDVVDISSSGKYVDICYEGKTRRVKNSQVQNHLRKGASLGSCELTARAGSNTSTKEVVTDEPAFAPELKLSSYPNPTSGYTVVSFSSQMDGPAKVSVLNTNGIEMATLFDDELVAKEEVEVGYEAGQLPSGIYIVRMVTAGEAKTIKLVVRK